MVSNWRIRSKIAPTEQFRNFGVVSDCDLTFSQQVQMICISALCHIETFSHQEAFRRTSVTLANALVSSRLNYCNSLFHSLSTTQLRHFQVTQNMLCRIATYTSAHVLVLVCVWPPHLPSRRVNSAAHGVVTPGQVQTPRPPPLSWACSTPGDWREHIWWWGADK